MTKTLKGETGLTLTHSSKLQPSVVESSQQQECEGAPHTVVRKQKTMDAGTQLPKSRERSSQNSLLVKSGLSGSSENENTQSREKLLIKIIETKAKKKLCRVLTRKEKKKEKRFYTPTGSHYIDIPDVAFSMSRIRQAMWFNVPFGVASQKRQILSAEIPSRLS
ncbi:uncharacterized protein LOC143435061 [Arvicanthis niloticus]|uniref:uncharacterized protein LOC143309413 n=1 Tax=Arvicanthis niloticus TaxID=61156 RepID=UPI00402BED9E